jgi:hypothetical protein
MTDTESYLCGNLYDEQLNVAGRNIYNVSVSVDMDKQNQMPMLQLQFRKFHFSVTIIMKRFIPPSQLLETSKRFNPYPADVENKASS